MQLGAVFPQTEIGADPAEVKAYAQGVQDMGFQHLMIYDHVVGADPVGHPGFKGPYNDKSLFHEPFVVFGYIAAVAPALELVTGVIILPQRQTVLVAKQAAEVDVLTGGKLRLGVGIGWNDVEYEALGQSFKTRGRRLEEQVALMRRLWTEPVITFEGADHRITAAGIMPLPVQRPIPVWIGASAEAALRRAAEIADGFFPQRALEDDWDRTLDKMRGWVEAAGRDWSKFGINPRVGLRTDSQSDWGKAAAEWRARGATHLSIATAGQGLVGVDAHLNHLRQVLGEVQGA